jgi:cysteinyl-tRNA synthetase
MPVEKGKVGIYSCGPTVYWNQHIGHMYAYVQWDCLVRFLSYLGNEVKWVMNITDVGHLTSDEDRGEDKMEKGAKREGLSVWQIADKYRLQFEESMKLLNIQKPDVLCRATEHIPEQIELIKKMEANGFTYMTKTGLVFDTSKFPDYASFAHLDLSKQEAGARVEVDSEKRQPWDFLLWVTNQPEHLMKWEGPWGVGFPGWHIECTAMSTKYLGERFDIHTGGKEHVAVHHTNEIAQGFGAFGHQTANFWLHNEWLMFNGEKISKSLGNSILVSDLIEKGFEPLALRYLILSSHYRSGLNFSWESLGAAQSALSKLRRAIGELGDGGKVSEEWKKKWVEVMEDDLNLPEGLAMVWQVLKSDLNEADKKATILDFDWVLGLDLALLRQGYGRVEKEVIIPEEVLVLVKKRDQLRNEKKWEEADEVRRQLEEKGFKVFDTKDGTSLG